ncbi:cyclic-di-AMP receptor [Oceanithermus sp.]
MKLVIAVVQDTDAANLINALGKVGLTSTKLSSTGGFLRKGNTTLLIGVDDERLNEVKTIIRDTCRTRTRLLTPETSMGETTDTRIGQPVEVQVGGAVVFVLDVAEFYKF